jgi:hypothetical protein
MRVVAGRCSKREARGGTHVCISIHNMYCPSRSRSGSSPTRTSEILHHWTRGDDGNCFRNGTNVGKKGRSFFNNRRQFGIRAATISKATTPELLVTSDKTTISSHRIPPHPNPPIVATAYRCRAQTSSEAKTVPSLARATLWRVSECLTGFLASKIESSSSRVRFLVSGIMK